MNTRSRCIFLPLRYYFDAEIMPKPEITEYPDFYAGYIGKVPEGSIQTLLASQFENTRDLFSGLSEAQSNQAYAPEKWSLKEVLGHIIDAERIFVYRALCMARGDRQPLPGMDQDLYMAGAHFARRPIKDLVGEYVAVRRATLSFVNSLTPEDLQKTGVANNGSFTVNALLYIIAGHELHHLDLVRTRYL